MDDTTTTPIALPRQRGEVTVRLGGLDEDLDALHEGDPLWWGQEFVAERVRSMPPDSPLLMLIAELEGEPVADAFIVGKGVHADGLCDGRDLRGPGARSRGVGAVVAEALAEATVAYGLPGSADSVYAQDEDSLAAANRLGFSIMGHHRESVLDLDTLDATVARASVSRAEDAGLSCGGFPDDADEAAWQELYDLVVDAWKDAPDSRAPTRWFRTPSSAVSARLVLRPHRLARRPTRRHDRHHRPGKDNALNTWFTGVAREARRSRAGDGAQGPPGAAHARARSSPDLHAEHGPERRDSCRQRPARLRGRARLLREERPVA